VPGKPELLGTTRDFLDYFSLKKLDDLPTLAQLKELEDLRVQLSLPGAEPAVELGGGMASSAGDSSEMPSHGAQSSDGPADFDTGTEEEELDAAQAEPRPQGLVARGADAD